MSYTNNPEECLRQIENAQALLRQARDTYESVAIRLIDQGVAVSSMLPHSSDLNSHISSLESISLIIQHALIENAL